MNLTEAQAVELIDLLDPHDPHRCHRCGGHSACFEDCPAPRTYPPVWCPWCHSLHPAAEYCPTPEPHDHCDPDHCDRSTRTRPKLELVTDDYEPPEPAADPYSPPDQRMDLSAVTYRGKIDVSVFCRRISREWADEHCYTPARGWFWRQPDKLWNPDPEALHLRKRIAQAISDNDISGTRTRQIRDELDALLAYHGDWDQDPTLVGLPDDTVYDIRRGTARPATAQDRISRRLGVMPDFDAATPYWDRVIDHVCCDTDEALWLTAWAGYTATGITREHRFVFMSGPGGGGKSTFTETIRAVMGSYAATLPEDVFTDGAARHREWIARLAGARMGVIADLPSGRWSNIGLLKGLVAGDTQTANYMHRGSFDFTPTLKLWLGGNARPTMGDADSGFGRRLVLIPVEKVPNPSKTFADRLTAELPAICGWMLQAATYYLDNGMEDVPPRWAAAAEQYLHEQDVIGQWIEDAVNFAPAAFTPNSVLLDSFNRYSGRKLGRITKIRDWLDANHPGRVEPARQRWTGQNPVRGLQGIELGQRL